MPKYIASQSPSGPKRTPTLPSTLFEFVKWKESEIRRDVYDNKIRCLRSFLSVLCVKWVASAAGVFTRDNQLGTVKLEREVSRSSRSVDPTIPSDGKAKFDELKEALLKRTSDPEQFDFRFPVQKDSAKEWFVWGRRIWPDSAAGGQGTWIYLVFSESGLIHPRLGIETVDIKMGLTTLAGVWFDWKHECWARLTTRLEAATSIEEVIKSIRDVGIFRPYRKRHILGVISHLRRIVSDPNQNPCAFTREHARLLEENFRSCVASSGEVISSEGRLICEENCKINGFCPQTAEETRLQSAMIWGQLLAGTEGDGSDREVMQSNANILADALRRDLTTGGPPSIRNFESEPTT